MPQPKPRPKKLNERKRRFQHSKLSSKEKKCWSYLQRTVRVLNRLKGNPKKQTNLGSPLLYLLKSVIKCTQLKSIAVPKYSLYP